MGEKVGEGGDSHIHVLTWGQITACCWAVLVGAPAENYSSFNTDLSQLYQWYEFWLVAFGRRHTYLTEGVKIEHQACSMIRRPLPCEQVASPLREFNDGR